MPTPTYDLIASSVLSSNSLSVTFSNIPQTYRDLVLVIDGTANSSEFIGIYCNGVITTNNDPAVHMIGNGSSATSSTSTAYAFYASTSKFNVIIQIIDYSTTNKHKTILTRSNAPSDRVVATASRVAQTAAISTIKINDSYWSGLNFLSGTTFHLYGIAG